MPQAPERLARTLDGPEICGNNLHPFARAAETLWHAGLARIPVGGEDGRKPLVTSFTKWNRRPGRAAIRKWIDRYPNANLGVVTGPLSGVTVVDVDSADLMVQQQMGERFGGPVKDADLRFLGSLREAR